MDKKYGIEIIGYGRRQKFCIKQILKNKLIIPVDGKIYFKKESAIEAAKILNIEISCIGDLYELLYIA